jgi:hypothetical protein
MAEWLASCAIMGKSVKSESPLLARIGLLFFSFEKIMNFKKLPWRGLAIFCGCFLTANLGAAPDTNNFNRKKINEMWPEMWKLGPTEVAPPVVDRLTRVQVINEMAGDWRVWLGERRTVLTLATNHQFHTSGTVRGEVWEGHGEWKIVANKLVLIPVEPILPLFIFRKKGTNMIFNPFVKEMMFPMERLNVPRTQPNDLSGIIVEPSFSAIGGKISESSVSNLLNIMDLGWMDGEASVAVANFASNSAVSLAENEFHNQMEYKIYLQTLFKSVDGARLHRTNLVVKISPDGSRATSESALNKTYLLSGHLQQFITTEFANFEIIDGNVSLTKLQSTVKTN